MSDGIGAFGAADPPRLRLLGAAIREARLAAGFTQVQLGHRLGVPQSVISTWEAGSVRHRVETVHALEATLGLAPGALLIAGGYVRVPAVEGGPERRAVR